MSWYAGGAVYFAQDHNLTIQCPYCRWQVCNETCLARHAERYHCHNSFCVDRPPHHPPQSQPAPAAEGVALDDASMPPTAASMTNPTPSAPSEHTTTAVGDPDVDVDLVYRETHHPRVQDGEWPIRAHPSHECHLVAHGPPAGRPDPTGVGVERRARRERSPPPSPPRLPSEITADEVAAQGRLVADSEEARRREGAEGPPQA